MIKIYSKLNKYDWIFFKILKNIEKLLLHLFLKVIIKYDFFIVIINYEDYLYLYVYI